VPGIDTGLESQSSGRQKVGLGSLGGPQGKTDGFIQYDLETKAGSSGFFLEEARHNRIQSHRSSHRDIMLPNSCAVKMLTKKSRKIRGGLIRVRPELP